MPHTPDRPDHQEGDFATLFARRARTPLRGFLPGRRVWTAVGGTAAAVLVITGAGAVVSRIDWSGGADEVTTVAAGEDTETSPSPSGTGKGARKTTPSPDASPGSKDRGPDVVYLPAPGGGGEGESAPDSTAKSTSPGDTGTTTEEERSTTASNTDSQQDAPTDYLWSDGNVDSDSNNYWDQSSITVKSTTALTALKVVVSIDQTGGVSNTGTWSSLGDKVNISAAANSDQLAYVVTLKSGVTLDAGTYVFQFQYNHSEGNRDAGGDRYNVTATSTASTTDFRKGGF